MCVSCTLKEKGKTKGLIDFLPLQTIIIQDNFWSKIIERNRRVTIPYAFKKCEETGRINNFAVAAGLTEDSYTGERYNDTDVFKIIEGASKTLQTHPDKQLENYLDSIIQLIAAAQEEDGYLFTARSASPENPAPGAGRERWIDIWVSHELYNAGHLYEAAVAHYKATGKRTLLDVAIKNADLVYNEFGWGKREAAPGHQEIEIGLQKLYEVTENEKYIELASFFLDVRGKPQEYQEHPPGTRFAIYNNKEYLQQHLPVIEQTGAIGHAVRATYMYTAMTDLAGKSEEYYDYYKKSAQLWEDVVSLKIYITGGVGAKHEGESFGKAYYLPNKEAYNETCAAIGNVLWNKSLFKYTGESKYFDVLERTLYNGLISGISQDGTHFFYPNPLESDGTYQRSPWFGVACCPGNLCRFLPSVPRLIYARAENDIYVNLFVASTAEVELEKNKLELVQKTEYPWNGNVQVTVGLKKPERLSIKIRIPSWLGYSPFEGDLYRYADSTRFVPDIRINGKPVRYSIDQGYACLTRKWKNMDLVEIEFPMPGRKITANSKVEANQERMAIERGPVVYCLEEADNGKIEQLVLQKDFSATYQFDPGLLGGSGVIKIRDKEHSLTAIPYYLWANRKPGEMEVWFKILTH